ncbi:MAG: lipoyl(octanoyl) transferase LipB [Burkholderiales bacterium]|jgi:lipoyl(octanoyl) transferase|nr:lipoyl(octanoyl) transferase LipB [Burkholderiales bacterium]
MAHTANPLLVVRRLGRVEYSTTWQAMQAFTAQRGPDTADELWLLEHPPVFTLGLAGRRSHILRASDIPIIASDRGGQVTYHGPGQIVAYLLLDLRRRGYGVRELVQRMEQAVIDLLADYGIEGRRRDKAPGVYVAEKKIAALGLRIRQGRSYHGLALNVDMDLAPFTWIDPCGYPGLEVTQLRDLGVAEPLPAVAERLAARLARCL